MCTTSSVTAISCNKGSFPTGCFSHKHFFRRLYIKHFKQIFSVLLAGVMALVLLAGCSQSSAYTISGTVTIRQNGETALADAPITIVTDGGKSYIKYEIEGYTVESIADSSSYYERSYPTGTAGGKWSQRSASSASSASTSTEAKSGTMTIDGVEYTTLTYDDVTYYCYKDNSLACLYTNTGAEETVIKISSIRTEVDTSLFQLPSASEIENAA